jgi:two-component system cell cycle response regulator
MRGVTRKRATPAPASRPNGATGATLALRRGARAEASLVIVYGAELGRRLPLTAAIFTVGRSSRCDLFIDQEAVSRRHAKIVRGGEGHTLIDLGSSNGTRVNDERIIERVLADGDRIQVGQTLLVFLSGENVETRFQEEIYRLMTVDGLTDVYNKRYFSETLDREYKRALRYERPLSLILFDVDGLDRIRSEHGAIAADATLQQIAAAVRTKLRQQDIFGRIGEGLFGILLPEIDVDGARTAAEKARTIVEAAPKEYDGAPLACTLSLGVAALSKAMAKPLDLLAAAQRALDESRRLGGNRVAGFEDEACRP